MLILTGPPLKKRKEELPSNSTSTSVSAQAKRSLNTRQFSCLPIYCHWFAIALYDVYTYAKSVLDKIEDEINDDSTITLELHGIEYTIHLSDLGRAHEAIKSACASLNHPLEVRGIMSSVELAEIEQTYTMRFARELDQFLFAKEPSKGACYHQAPSRCRLSDSRTCEQCDISCAPFIKNTYYPGGPVLIADLKNADFVTAQRESALYGTNSSKVQKGTPRWEIMIGIPGSKEKMNLEVYIPGNHTLAIVPVVENCCPSDRALLCTIYSAVHYLCEHPISQGSPLTPKPRSDFEVKPYNNGFRVFIDKDQQKVFKLFDTKSQVEQPNGQLLGKLNIWNTHHQLSNDGRFLMLEIKYIPGTHRPKSVLHFRGAVEQLYKIHSMGIVHGDIRNANIVFDDADCSYIIDYDLARMENDVYPSGYVTSHTERHHSARPGEAMRKIHDKHALFQIICKHFPLKKALKLADKDLNTWMELLQSSSS